MTTDIYTTYATVYDALGQARWGTALARFVLDVVLPSRDAPVSAALDLACGTGAVAIVLAGAGLRVVGLDRSAGMLREARRKADAAGLPLPLVRGDLRAFAFARRFDLITCAYDSLNYLTRPDELRAALALVRDALAPGGLVVCDLTTRHAYTGPLDGIAHRLAVGDLTHRWLTTWDEPAHLATTTLSTQPHHHMSARGESSPSPAHGGGSPPQRRGGVPTPWQTEYHVQRPRAPAEVAEALHRSGLRLLASYGTTGGGMPATDPPEPSAPRVIYVAARAN